MRKLLALVILVLWLTVGSFASEITLKRGWNLVGSSCDVPLEEISYLPVRSVWVWDEEDREWNFWSPIDNLREVASFYGIPVIENVIPAFKGFWVQSEGNATLKLCDYRNNVVLIYGKVKWLNLEEGFYGIEDITGEKYLDIDKQLKDYVGSCIKGIGIIDKDSYGPYQWGTPISVLNFKQVPCFFENVTSTDVEDNETQLDNQTLYGKGRFLAFYSIKNVKKILKVDSDTLLMRANDRLCLMNLKRLLKYGIDAAGMDCERIEELVDCDSEDGWMVRVADGGENSVIRVEKVEKSGKMYKLHIYSPLFLKDRVQMIKVLKVSNSTVDFVVASLSSIYLGRFDGKTTYIVDSKSIGDSITPYQIYAIDTYYPKVLVQAESLGVSIYDTSNATLNVAKCCSIDSYHGRYLSALRYPEVLIAGSVMYQGMDEEEIGHLDCGVAVVNVETKRIKYCVRNVEGRKAVFIYPDSTEMVAVIGFDGNLRIVNLAADPNWNIYDEVSVGEQINDVFPLENGTLLMSTDSGVYVYKLPF